MMPPLAYMIIKGHNSATVKEATHKFEIDLLFGIISIVYQIHIIFR